MLSPVYVDLLCLLSLLVLDALVLPPPPFKLNAFIIPFACASPIAFKNALSFNNLASFVVSINKVSDNMAGIFDSRKTWKLAFFLPRFVMLYFLSTLFISLWTISRNFAVLDELLSPL